MYLGSQLRVLAASVATGLTYFPRLQFNAGFERLLLEYCERKPLAQIGTWTDELCRNHVHAVAFQPSSKD